jgi:hypothetical protein
MSGGVKRPWSEMSMGQKVPWDEMTMGQNARAVKFHGASCHEARCPWGRLRFGKLSGLRTNHELPWS